MTSASIYHFGEFELRPADFALVHHGARIRLSPKAFDVLRVLVERHGRLVEKDDLLRVVWPDTFVEDANLSVQVAAIRRVLGNPPQGGEYIETVPKRGYRFSASVIESETPGAAGADAAGPVTPAAESGRGHVRLVVLPLTILRPDPETDYLAFSLPDAIASALAELSWLQVRSPHVSAGRGGEDLAALGAVTGGTHALAGTLLRMSDGLRVTLQVLDLPAGTVRWSESLTTSLDALFDVEQEATRRLCRVLATGSLGLQGARPAITHPPSAAGYGFFLRANQLAYEASRWADARELYQECLRVDPGYAPAWAGLARCQRVIGKYTVSDPEGAALLADAERGFQRALALDPELAVAHNLYAQLEVDLGRAPDAMERLLARAGRRPLDAQLYAGLVHALRFCGLLDESVAAHRRARDLDQTVPTSVHHTWWMLGEFERALGETFGDIGYMPGLALASLGREAEAVATLRWRERETTDSRVRRLLISLRALLEGGREESLEALDQASSSLLDAEARYYLARSYARLGEPARALALLDRAVKGGFLCWQPILNDPWFSALSGLPAFEHLIQHARGGSAQARSRYLSTGGPAVLGLAT